RQNAGSRDPRSGERGYGRLNLDQDETRSFASNSGSSSNLGQRRSTRAIGSRLMRSMNAWQAAIKSGTLWWQKPRVTSSRIQSHGRSVGLGSGLYRGGLKGGVPSGAVSAVPPLATWRGALSQISTSRPFLPARQATRARRNSTVCSPLHQPFCHRKHSPLLKSYAP